MLVAVLSDVHAHADALDAVINASEQRGVAELWSLGDMIGRGPDPENVVARIRERCTVALMGNHDYAATGAVDPERFGERGSPAFRSLELACEQLTGANIEWLRSRKPAARRDGVRCWHASPRNPVWEFVGSSNAGACLAAQRAQLGFVGHAHVAGAWQQTPSGVARRVKITPGVSLDISAGKWLLNPGAVGPAPSRLGWWDALDAQAADGAFWLLIDLAQRTATWQRAPYDPTPARDRARSLGLDDPAPRASYHGVRNRVHALGSPSRAAVTPSLTPARRTNSSKRCAP